MISSKSVILVPDSLPTSHLKPGPSLRNTLEFTSLASALKNKQFLSDWIFESESSELQLRESLNRTLADDCYFAYVKSDFKVPLAFPRSKGRNLTEILTQSGSKDFIKPNGAKWLGTTTPPRSGNWAAIPKLNSRIYVLDFDVRKIKTSSDGKGVLTTKNERWDEAHTNLNLMGKALGVDLSKTYAQISPSGGIHVFLRLPKGVNPRDLPATKFNDGMRKLVGTPSYDWGTCFQGDIRSGAAKGIILMAGSNILSEGKSNIYVPAVSTGRGSEVFKDYKMGRKLNILELPMHAIEVLKESIRITESIKLNEAEMRRAASIRSKTSSDSGISPRHKVSKFDDSTTLPESIIATNFDSKMAADLVSLPGVKTVLEGLTNVPKLSFHSSRAHIFKALSCCYTNSELIDICRHSGYGRDSYRERELTDEELQGDFDSLRKRGFAAERCGSHCASKLGQRMRSRQIPRPDSLVFDSIESYSIHNISKLRASSKRDFISRDPRSFDPNAVTIALLGKDLIGDILSGKNRNVAAYRVNALDLAMNYFNPLFNGGASEVLASSKKLMETFNLTDSQLRSAMRHLRETGVLKLIRRQVQGSAPGYGMGSSSFVDNRIGYYLRKTWAMSAVIDGRGRRSHIGGYFDYATGQIRRVAGGSHRNTYLLEVAGGFTALLEQLNVQLSALSKTGGKLLSSYMRKPMARYDAVKSMEKPVSELTVLDDCVGSNSADDSSESTSFVSPNVHWRNAWRNPGRAENNPAVGNSVNKFSVDRHRAPFFGNSSSIKLIPKALGPPGMLVPRNSTLQYLANNHF